MARSASFVMKAGKIAGCTAARGGGVYVGMAVLSVRGSAAGFGEKAEVSETKKKHPRVLLF